MNNHTDILIVTATKVESKAIFNTFRRATGLSPKPVQIAARIYHDLGIVNDTHVFMAQSEMGASGLGASQQTVQKGILALSPNAVIMVGIAFGVNAEKQKIGDILVSKQIMMYESQRVGSHEIIPRGARADSSPWLLDRFRSSDLYWDESKANVRFGLILSGEKLVDNLEFCRELLRLEPEAIGGEMEGGGLYVTCQDCQVDWILIKAICDWADGHKSQDKEQRQQLAAHNAAEFLLHVIQQAPLRRKQITSSYDEIENSLKNNTRKAKVEGDYVEGNKIVYLQPSSFKADRHYKDIVLTIPSPPSVLIGREKLISDINADLQAGEQVSINGLGGIGKTSLAAFVAKEEYDRGYKVFWVKAGHLNLEKLCDEIGRTLGDQTIIGMNLQRKLNQLRTLLHLYEIRIVILDDVWDVASARAFAREALPSGCTILVTSRKRIGVGKPYDVEHLNEDDSEKLFRYHSKITNESVTKICRLLNGHPMALEIAGKACWINGLTAVEFQNHLEKEGNIIRSLALSDDVHENMWASLQTSYELLNEGEKCLFKAFGTLWNVTGTAEILSSILGDDNVQIQTYLNGLVANSLIRPETTTDGLRTYRLHDLAYDFAHAIINQENIETNRQRTLLAYKIYAEKYVRQDRTDHNFLEAERENLLNSVEWAFKQKEWSYVNSLALCLYDKSEFLRWRGYSTEATHLLLLGLEAARALGNQHNIGRHLINLGIAYRQLGQIEKGIEFHKQSLEIMRSIDDKQGESDSLGEIGWAYNRLGRMEEAINHLKQAYEITHEIGNKRWEAIWLGTLGRVYTDIGQIDDGINCHQQAFNIMATIGDKRGQGARLGELGWDYLALEQPEQAIKHFQAALDIAVDIGDRRREGAWLGGIGEAYLLLKQPEKAVNYLNQSIQIARIIGDRGNEAEVLNCLAIFELMSNEFDRANSLTQQSLNIYQELNHQRGIGDCLHMLGDISVAQAKMLSEATDNELLNKAKDFYLEAANIRKSIKDTRFLKTQLAINSLSQVNQQD